MSLVNPQTKHDFINNSLRLEVLTKLICKDLDQNTKPSDQFLEDLEKFLNIELNLLKDLKTQLHSH
jgi:hypothetical protein